MNTERTVLIHLLAGGTPKQLRAAIKSAGLMRGPELTPRVICSWLRNGREGLNNQEIADRIAQQIPASTIRVHDLGNGVSGIGPNLPLVVKGGAS